MSACRHLYPYASGEGSGLDYLTCDNILCEQGYYCVHNNSYEPYCVRHDDTPSSPSKSYHSDPSTTNKPIMPPTCNEYPEGESGEKSITMSYIKGRHHEKSTMEYIPLQLEDWPKKVF